MSRISKTLGNFEITSRLGKGGMGEVYHARDDRLGRNVAIKMLHYMSWDTRQPQISPVARHELY